MTNHRIYLEPTPPAVALDFCTAVLESSAAVRVRPGPRHRRVFQDLCRRLKTRGTAVPEAYLTALALEHGATWVTTDRDFARFPGLRWQVPPLDPDPGS